MKVLRAFLSVIMVLSFVATGCSLHEEILPNHDEVLIFDLAYDLTYLRTFEALETLDDWEIEGTEKGKGIIWVGNIAYGKFGDADKRLATIYIQRLNRDQTTVQLAPESRRVLGGGMLLERISEFLSKQMDTKS